MAPYTIKVRIYQTSTSTYFEVVEKACFYYANGGVWQSCGDSVESLTMGGSGTSGMLRFKTEEGKEGFFVATGIHNSKPWVDIVTNLDDNYTAVKALPEYYDDTHKDRNAAREAQRSKWSATNNTGRTITAQFKSTDGASLSLDIIIG